MSRVRIVRSAALVAVLTLTALAGCDLYGPGSDPSEVTVDIDSEDGSRVLLITSEDFTVGVDESGEEAVFLEVADSTWVRPAFQGSYILEPAGEGIIGFYARAAECENPDARVSMRVAIDGEESYADEKVLTGSGLRFYFQR